MRMDRHNLVSRVVDALAAGIDAGFGGFTGHR